MAEYADYQIEEDERKMLAEKIPIISKEGYQWWRPRVVGSYTVHITKMKDSHIIHSIARCKKLGWRVDWIEPLEAELDRRKKKDKKMLESIGI